MFTDGPHYWPGLVIGVLIGAYWARVLHLVRKTRKTTGHSANFLPPEPIGRALRIIWIPAVCVWFALPLVLFARPNVARGFELLWNNPIIAWLGVLIALAAFFATLVCWKKMGKSWRMGIDPTEKTQLVFGGPWAYVRHPIYALQCLLLLASFVAVPTIAMAVVALIGITLLQWEARREEKYLVEKHGAEYATYIEHVGRFMPRSARAYRTN